MGPKMKKVPEKTSQNSELILYQTEDGKTRLDVRFEGDTAWLSQSQMAELFQTTKQNISLHVQNIFEERELEREATVKEYLTVQREGERDVTRKVDYYNLDIIISVGYRVKSHRGTQFRIWATQRLREFIIKGFTLDDERLKQRGGGNYFDELLARIRDIRSSKKYSGAKSSKSMPPVSITTQTRRFPSNFLPLCKIKCIGRLMATRPRKSSPGGPMRPDPKWA